MSNLNITSDQVPTESVSLKRCGRCKEMKRTTALGDLPAEFGRNAGRKDKLQAFCIPCTRISTRESIERTKTKAKTKGQGTVEDAR